MPIRLCRCSCLTAIPWRGIQVAPKRALPGSTNQIASKRCIVGIRVPSAILKAFDVRIIGEDVYVNYRDVSTPEAHGSYHASGQRHIKIDGHYVEWTGGPAGTMGPMKLFAMPPRDINEREHWWTIGWEVSRLPSVLPELTHVPDMTVDAQNLSDDSILGLMVSIIGQEAERRVSIAGFPVLARHQFGSCPRDCWTLGAARHLGVGRDEGRQGSVRRHRPAAGV